MSIFESMFAKPGPPPKAYTDEYAPDYPNGGRCWTCKQPVKWRKSRAWLRHIHTENGYVARYFEDFEDCANFDGGHRSPPFATEYMPKHWAMFYWDCDFENSPGHEECSRAAEVSHKKYIAGQGAVAPEREMTQSEFEDRCASANLPLALAEACTFASFDPTRITSGEAITVIDDSGQQRGRWDTSQNLLEILEQWRPKDPPVMLCGGTGIGKTHLLAAFATKWLRRRMQIRFHNASNFLTEYRALSFSKNDHDNARAKLMHDDACRANLLVIDDLGVAQNTKFTDTIWYEILNFRIERKLPTFFTTNLSPQGIAESFDERFRSRIKGSTRIFLVKGTDYRALGVSRQ